MYVNAALQVSDLPTELLACILRHLPPAECLISCAFVSTSWATAARVRTEVSMRRVRRPLPSLTLQPWLQQHARHLAIGVRPMTRDLQLQLPCAELQQLSKLDLQQIQLSVAPTDSLLPSLKRLKLFNCSLSPALWSSCLSCPASHA